VVTDNASYPVGFCQRMPGLEKLGDAAVRLAISSGDGQALYDALGKLAKDRAGTTEATQAQKWLLDRRLFLWPYKRAPSLHRVNGVGAGLYGSSEKDPSDGTYIATYCASFVFFPVFPIGQYLVRDAGGNSYNIFGKIPVSGVVRAWRRAFGLAAAASAALIALAVVRSHHTAHVQLVNGLSIPVEVSIAGSTGWVAPGAHLERTLKAGKAEIVARDKQKRILETLSVDLPGATDLVAYNVLGAAPLYAEGVVYYANDKGKNQPNPVITYGGDSFVYRDHIQYIFEKPPESIQMDGSQETRWAFQLAKGGLGTALEMLEDKKQEKRAAELARKVALAVPTAAGFRAAGRYLASDTELELFAQAAVDAHPDSGDAQRLYQDTLRSLGKVKEAQAYAERLKEKAPGSALPGYLLARLLPYQQALPAFLQLVEQHPKDPDALRGASYDLFVARRFKEALALYDRWAEVDPSGASAALTWHVRAALGAGDLKAALRVAAAGAQRERAEDQPVHRAILYGQVAHLAGKTAPYPATYFFEQLKTSELWLRAFFTASVGRPPGSADLAKSPEPVRRGVQMIEALRHDLSRTLGLIDPASAKLLVGYDALGALLLGLELERGGDKERAELLLKPVAERGYPLEEIRRYLKTGEESDGFKESDLDMQAVARFIRARSLEAAHHPAEALYRAAVEDDLLHATVAEAEKAWPHPVR
jgi:tetratricopeptide (TPR) repeat protein